MAAVQEGRGVHIAAGSGDVTRRVVDALGGVVERPYFAPLCDDRLLAVRHYDWEPLAKVGDMLHVSALLLCLCACLRDSSSLLPPQGISLKTHLLFLLVFSLRFSNVLLCDQPLGLVIYKAVLWTATLKIVMVLVVRGAASDLKDTMPLGLLIFPLAVLTMVFGTYSGQDHGLAFEILWIFSNYVEGFAMLPQYVYCYRDHDNLDWCVSGYVMLMGACRTVFGLNWLFPAAMGEAELDISTVVSGVLGVALFADYVAFRRRSSSLLSHFCISVDDDLRDVQDIAVDIARGNTSPSTMLAVLEAASPAQGHAVLSEMIGRPHREVELHCMIPESDE